MDRLNDRVLYDLFVLILQRSDGHKDLNPASRNQQGYVSFDWEKGGLKRREVTLVTDKRFNDRVLDSYFSVQK